MWKSEDEHTYGHYFRFIHRPVFKTRRLGIQYVCVVGCKASYTVGRAGE